MISIPYFTRRDLFGRGGYLELWNIAYPLIILSASNTFMQFVDRKFLASNSTLDVAAAMPAGILYFTLFSFFMVTANFTSTLVAQYYGADDRNSLLGAVWTGFYFSVGASLLIIFALPMLGVALIERGGHSPELIERELEYFYALIPSGAFACLAAPFFCFFSGCGKTVPVSLINTIACLLNIPLDYVFIFGWGPIPALGILGAGIATSLCASFSFLTILCYFLSVDQRQFPTRDRSGVKWDFLRRLLRYGTPSGLQVFFEVAAFTLATFLIGKLGSLPLASHVIALSINNMFFIPLLGMSDATSIVAGQYIGRQRHEIARRTAYRAWRLGLLYMCLGGFVYLFFPTALANLFAPSGAAAGDFAEVIDTTRWLLVCAVFYNFADTLKYIFVGALRGAGDTASVLLITSGCAYLVMVPGVFILIHVVGASVVTVWMFLAAYAFLEGGLVLWRFRSNRWQKIRLIQHKTAAVAVDSGEPAVL